VFVQAPADAKGVLVESMKVVVDPASLRLIPGTASTAGALPMDAGNFFKQVREFMGMVNPHDAAEMDRGLARFRATTGLDLQTDLLEPLGNQWLYYTDPAVGGSGLTGLVVINTCRDAAKLEKSLDALGDWLNRQANNQRPSLEDPAIRMATTERGGVKVRYLAITAVAPAWTVKDGRLYLGPYPQVVLAAATRPAGAPALVDDPSFVALTRRLTAGPLVSWSYANLPQTADAGYGIALPMLRLIQGFGDMQGATSPALLLPDLPTLRAHLSPSMTVAWQEADGSRIRMLTPFPGAELVASAQPGGLAAPALGAGILLPALGAGRNTANQMKSSTQVSSIVKGMILWTDAHSPNDLKFPPDIGTIVVDSQEWLRPETVISPFDSVAIPPGYARWDRDRRRQWINENTSYVYLGKGRTNELNSEQILVYEKLNIARRDRVSVGFGDAHSEVLSVEELVRRLKEQFPDHKPVGLE
jgi:hypothetical protein